MAIKMKQKALFTLDKENVNFLNEYSKITNMNKSAFINNLLTELRLSSNELFNDIFVGDDKNLENADSYMLLMKSIKHLNNQQNKILDLLTTSDKERLNGEAK